MIYKLVKIIKVNIKKIIKMNIIESKQKSLFQVILLFPYKFLQKILQEIILIKIQIFQKLVMVKVLQIKYYIL